MCRISSEKVHACNYDKGVLYFACYTENGDILLKMKEAGQQIKTVVLPYVYDNKYDVLTVWKRRDSHVVVGKADGGRLFFFRIGYEGSIFHEQIGALGVIHVIYFHLEGNDYLSVAYQKGEGIIFQYDEDTKKFIQIWNSQNSYILNVTETLENMLGVESYNVSENRTECIIVERNSGKRYMEISFNAASVEQFCCDIGSYVIASNVLGERRFFSVSYIADNSVTLLDIGYKAGHEYRYLYCIDRKVIVYHDICATAADIVLYDIIEEKELCRIWDVMPYSKCIQKNEGELLVAAMNINSQLLVYSVDLSSYETSEIYRYRSQKHEMVVCKKKVKITDKRIMDYIVYEQVGKDVQGDICVLHGGPNTHWFPRYQKEICDMTELGFKVYYSNYFGSSGYGKIDYTKQENKWGGQDVEDIICLGENIPSGKRILYGESYGGFLAFLTWLKMPELWDKVILYAPFFSPDSLHDALAGNELVQRTVERCGQPNMEYWIWKTGLEKKEIYNTEFFVIHGTEDMIVPCRESVKIVKYLSKCFRWRKSLPKLFLLEGVGHTGGGIEKERQKDRLIISILRN